MTTARDRKIDREIAQSSRLARLPLHELTVPKIDRKLAPRRERTVPVNLYVRPVYECSYTFGVVPGWTSALQGDPIASHPLNPHIPEK